MHVNTIDTGLVRPAGLSEAQGAGSVGSLGGSAARTIDNLRSRVGGYTGIPWDVIKSPRRTPSVVRARWALMLCLDEMMPWLSLCDIAKIVHRDCHGTVVHGLRKAKELYERDDNFRKLVDAVMESE
jgi:chromosomal replication initiation ATPase DnaA